MRQQLRKRKAERFKRILAEFVDLDRLDDARRLPVRDARPAGAHELQPDDFAAYLTDVFRTDLPVQHGTATALLESIQAGGVSTTQPFDMGEMQYALKKMKNRKTSDERGVVAEMFKHASYEFLTTLLEFYNEMLFTGQVHESWRETLFTMLPKPGDASVVKNWRPIAILRISYKLFARLLYHRLRPVLDLHQSPDQVGFRTGRCVDDAFVVLETVCSKCAEWCLPMWCMSLDLSKAFDRIEFQPLFRSLADQGVREEYLKILVSIYTGQTGRLRGSEGFGIQRGVKQGDVLSPLLFNAGLEAAVRNWKLRTLGCGIVVDEGERLTNIRYADDLLVFATSADELCRMTEILQEELARVGLQLNSSKTKALTLEMSDSPRFLDVYGEFVQVLGPCDFHKYLGRKLSGDVKERSKLELSHRVQIAWMRFHKHRDILLDRNINIRSRLKFFNSVISTTVLYGLPACALTAQQVESLDILQRKMLRRIVGWARQGDEEWSETMRRMRMKVDRALCLYPVEAWSKQLLRRQFRMVCRLSRCRDEWAMRVSCWNPILTNAAACRTRGRPATRWDDRLNMFTRSHLESDSWQEACANLDFPKYENLYIQFHSDGA